MKRKKWKSKIRVAVARPHGEECRNPGLARALRSGVFTLGVLVLSGGMMDEGRAQSTAAEWIAPASAAALRNPVAFDEPSIIAGKTYFDAACVACHGATGAGDGVAAVALSPKPRDLTSPVLWSESDGTLYWKIMEGRAPMPAFKDAIDPSQGWNLVNYIRTLAPKPEGYTPPAAVSADTVTVPSAASEESVSGSSDSGFVSREEYERLKLEIQELRSQIFGAQEGSVDRAGVEAVASAGDAAMNDSDSSESLNTQLDDLRAEMDSLKGGASQHLFTGYAFAGYSDRSGDGRGVNAGFAPIFLWKPTERLFFEGELELGLADGETELNLEYAQIAYSLNDQVTVGAGKFLSPFGIFRERLHPAWINKLPDAPLAFGHDGIIPPTILGAQVRGAVPFGETRFHYSLYAGNGPELNNGGDEAEEAGMLHFDNYDDFGDNKAFGGRFGFLPVPELEIGYSGQYSVVDAEGTSQRDADAWLHGPYLSYVRDSELLKGVIDIKTEWAWSQVDDLTYDPDGSLGFGPVMFDNSRDGGYAQIAYRPTKLNVRCLTDVETVFRFDRLNLPAGAPESHDENRYSFGLNYWLGPTTVFKASYQFGQRKESGEEAENFDAFLLQAAMGF